MVAQEVAALALLPEYFPRADSSLRSVAVVLSMFEHGLRADYKSAGALLFEEITTGMKRSVREAARVPSNFERRSDKARPYDRRHRDGTRGFTPDDDDAVMFYSRYLKIQQRVYEANPKFNFELCIKCPFVQLTNKPHQFYSKEERMEMNLGEKIQTLQNRYTVNVARAKGYDLLDRLMIDALLEYLRDTSAPRAARESYVAQAERLIGDEVVLPQQTGSVECHAQERAE